MWNGSRAARFPTRHGFSAICSDPTLFFRSIRAGTGLARGLPKHDRDRPAERVTCHEALALSWNLRTHVGHRPRRLLWRMEDSRGFLGQYPDGPCSTRFSERRSCCRIFRVSSTGTHSRAGSSLSRTRRGPAREPVQDRRGLRHQPQHGKSLTVRPIAAFRLARKSRRPASISHNTTPAA